MCPACVWPVIDGKNSLFSNQTTDTQPNRQAINENSP